MTRHLIKGQFTNTRDDRRCGDYCPFCKRQCDHPSGHLRLMETTVIPHQCLVHWWVRIIEPDNQMSVIGATYGNIQEKINGPKKPVLNPRQRGSYR